MSYLGTLNSLLTSTTSRYANLRRNILSSSSEDDSGIQDPEDSHVSRVLRAYYTEKARPFPAWLGVDPREAAKAQQREQQPYVSTRPTGSLRGNSTVSNASDQRSSSGLSDLWSDGPAPPPTDDRERNSLRRGPLGGGRRGQMSQPSQYQDQNLNVRPLPSQRAGSYQSRDQQLASQQSPYQQSASPVPPGSSGSAAGSARDRLRDRLNRGGGVEDQLQKLLREDMMI
ncbi:hypothetical protein ABVK25_010937 [Lepraria finkii]|uniref:Mso1 N-terminal domain-containing protein n=1 Tax=Lepraria finkii TaxID=1340010 RepID=A0ABR4AV99_9LECA